MSERRKIIIILVALLGMVLVRLGIHFRPSSPRLAELGDYCVSTDEKTLGIDLTSNSGTGCSWVANDVNSETITLEGVTHHTYPNKSDIVSSGGCSQLTGKVTRSGKQSFRLTYCQDWNSDEKKMTYQTTVNNTKNKISKIKLTEVSE